MAAPTYLASTFRFLQLLGVSDVQTVMNNLAVELVAGGWTDEGSGTYKSPVDAVGRFFKANFVRVDSGNLQMIVSDQNAQTIGTRRCYGATNATWSIFTGPFHIYLEANRISAAAEYMAGGILDFSPEAQSATTRYVYMNGYRNNLNATVNSNWTYWNMMDNVTIALTQRAMSPRAQVSTYAPAYDQSMNLVFHPLCMFASTASLVSAYAGRAYQMVLLWDYASESGTRVKVPIDGSTLGEFMICRGSGSNNGLVLAVRCA